MRHSYSLFSILSSVAIISFLRKGQWRQPSSDKSHYLKCNTYSKIYIDLKSLSLDTRDRKSSKLKQFRPSTDNHRFAVKNASFWQKYWDRVHEKTNQCTCISLYGGLFIHYLCWTRVKGRNNFGVVWLRTLQGKQLCANAESRSINQTRKRFAKLVIDKSDHPKTDFSGLRWCVLSVCYTESNKCLHVRRLIA